MHRLSRSAPLLVAAALAACQQQQPANDAGPVEQSAPALPSVPAPVAPLDRQALLRAVAEAASAASLGSEMPDSVRSLDGRQFEVRIRFGCRGPASSFDQSWLGWSFDPEQRRIRVRAMPTITSDDPAVRQLVDGGFEAVEGFWLPRPWLLEAACPAPAAEQQSVPDESKPDEEDASEPTVLAPKIGIAQFFTSDEPRSRRRDARPYQAAHTLDEGKALSAQGYNLVLSGRLRALPGVGVMHCVSSSPDSPPDCIVSAEFQRVWIERPDSGEVIAEWGSG